ncbi:MAG: RIP metalloprotease RseP [Longimicrobiales bacterium]
MLITILATVLVLGVLILVHELGHFWMAKLADIAVPRFSIGLGPKMVGFRRGETEYVISWVPLGGYVRMAGMEDLEAIEGGPDAGKAATVTDVGLVSERADHERDGRDFESKSVAMRSAVIVAGVVMNMVFAVVVYAAVAGIWGIQRVPEARIARVDAAALPAGTEALTELPPNVRIEAVGDDEVSDWQDLALTLAAAPAGPTTIQLESAPSLTIELPEQNESRAALLGALQPAIDLEPVIGSIVEGMPAHAAGLEPGDRIVGAAGRPVETWQDLVNIIQARPGRPVPLVVRRGESRLELTATPVAREIDARAEPVGQLGVLAMVPVEHPGPLGALRHGLEQTWFYTTFTVDFLADLITGSASPRNVGGPILIGQLSGEVARQGTRALLDFMALLSINLAIFNLLPIPVLDGGQLVFLGIEAVRGRALSMQQRLRLTQAGLFFLMALMVWVIANDVLRLFGI